MSLPELQALNYVLGHKDYGLIRQNGLTADHFPAYQDEFTFIQEHVRKYDQVPDMESFLAEFPDFEKLEVEESPKYLADRLKELRLYALVVPTLKQAAEMAQGDATEVVRFLQEQVKGLTREMLRKGEALDLVQKVQNRIAEYERRMAVEGLLGIPSGLPSLDDVTHGWLPGDVVVVAGFLGMGKSWMGLYLLIQAWRSGYKVALVSLEMDELAVGFRFDTLLTGATWSDPKADEHFPPVQNTGLIAGRLSQEADDSYRRYARWAKDKTGRFLLYTSRDFPNGFTTDELENLFDEHPDLDMVAIDQLSLMRPLIKTRSIRESYIEIMRETKAIAMRRGRVILMLAQANREAAKSGKDGQFAPETWQLGESNAVGEDADRVLTLNGAEGIMNLALKKNRHGKGGMSWMLRWNVDEGEIHEMTGDRNF